MLQARILAHDGQPERLIAADDEIFQKGDFYELSSRGLLTCSGIGADAKPCCARVTHVQGGYTDGGVNMRIAHFRTDDIEQHAKRCEHIDDPRDAKRTHTFRRALDLGLPILINVNIGHMGVKNGAKLLQPQFNAGVNTPESDLWKKPQWLKHMAEANGVEQDDILRVPARDITDILYYINLAKEHGMNNGGKDAAQKAMKQLWFNTGHVIQSCNRFVVKDSPARMGSLVQKFMQHANVTPRLSSELFETPRLFLFEATDKQIADAKTKVSNQLYGQHFDMELGGNKNPDLVQRIILGMRMKREELDNQRILANGKQLWVVAVPTFSRLRAFEIKNKRLGLKTDYTKPGYIFLQVANPSQIVSSAAPIKKHQFPRPTSMVQSTQTAPALQAAV